MIILCCSFALVWITEQPRCVKGVIGSPAILHCKAESLGPITYSWFRSDTKEGRLKPVYQSVSEWYVINHLAQKHWGYYVCHAENQYEYAASRRVHISAHLPTAATLTRRTKCKYCCIIPTKTPPMNLGSSQKCILFFFVTLCSCAAIDQDLEAAMVSVDP